MPFSRASLLESKVLRYISFVPTRDDRPGSVRVHDDIKAKYTFAEKKKTHIPAGHEIEISGC